MTSIKASVGRGGKNCPGDVKNVQEWLNSHRAFYLHTIKEDGKIGPETIGAIEEFQRRKVKMSRPDGRVDPGGPTLRALTGHRKSHRSHPISSGVIASATNITDYHGLVTFAEQHGFTVTSTTHG